MVTGTTVLKVAAVVFGLLVVSGGALGAYALSGGVQEPSVEDVTVRWGEVTQDTSEIRATVVVDNPNAVGVPGVIDIEYTASLNSVAIAEGVKEGVGLPTGQSEIELVIPIENRKITEWWVTHVNQEEESTLAIEASVNGPAGVSFALPTQQQAFETDILGGLGSEGGDELTLLGEPFLTLGERTAEWGEATAESTPLTVSAEVTNEHDEPLRFDGVGYVIEMNGITMGEGEDMSGLTVEPGETGTLEIDAALDTGRIDDWWVSHLNANETTTLTVETYAIVDGGEDDPTVELDLIQLGMDLRTDLLGGGGASTSDVSTTVGGDLEYEPPGVSVSGLAWGEVTDATTELQASLDIDNPNTDSPLNELVDLTVHQRAAVNDVEVADETHRMEDLPAGEATESLSIAMDNAKVPEWWAAHVNNGETSTVAISSTADVDIGVTTFELDVAQQEQSFSTDMLAGMNADRSRTLSVDGDEVATVTSTAASWGEATAQETPIDAEIALQNVRDRVDVTVSDVSYTMTMNDVTVADGTDPASITLEPGASGSLEFTMTIDSQRMDEWWISHIENGEETTLSVTLSATIEAGGETEQVTIDFLGGDSTVTTDILGSA